MFISYSCFRVKVEVMELYCSLNKLVLFSLIVRIYYFKFFSFVELFSSYYKFILLKPGKKCAASLLSSNTGFYGYATLTGGILGNYSSGITGKIYR